MKKFKKLIPAFAMLLVSAIMLGSSTFAWFSMNDKVTANGMNVEAQSNTEYFVISSSDTLGTEKTVNASKNAGGISDTNAKIYPCSFATAAQTIDSVSIAANKFYTCFSNTYEDPATGDAASKRFNATVLEDGDASYMYTYKVWIGLSAGSSTVSKKVKMTASITGNAGLVVVFNGATFALESSTQENDKSYTTGTALSFTAGEGKEVTFYVYIDGENADVKDGASEDDLKGSVSVSFEFVD